MSKISKTKKISNKQFDHCRANIFLEKVPKSINSQTNIKSLSNKSSGNDSLNFTNRKILQTPFK